MPSLRIRLFGTPRVTVGRVPVDISRDKSLALLAYLAVTETPQRRDRLAALFWPESSQTSARAYLRNALYTLSKALGPGLLESDRRQIGLAPSADWQTDVRQFAAHLVAAEKGSAGATEHLTQAAALATDEFLAGFFLPDAPEFDDWTRFQRQALNGKLNWVLQSLVAHHDARGDVPQAIDYARRRVALDPLDEAAQRTLIGLYVKAGQRHAAICQCEEIAGLLRTELDALPSEEIQTLCEEIRHDHMTEVALPQAQVSVIDVPDRERSRTAFPDNSETEAIRRGELPYPPTPLVGREEELEKLDELLKTDNVRLITITGPGGMGKTRLGLACAERQQRSGDYADGVHFVALAALEDGGQLAHAIADTVGCVLRQSDEGDQSVEDQVVWHLHDMHALIVLDSFEHLLDGARLVSEILRVAPGVRLLVTSRERLHMHSEYVFPIRGLDYGTQRPEDPTSMTDAESLFMQRARRSAPDIALDRADLDHVSHICELVAGMPLAIELAASWLDLLGPAEIATEIEQNVDFLATEMTDLPPRHRSIQAVFDTSWGSLDEEEKRMFARLSVFRGGFTREAAREVAGATLQQLRTLARKSLIQPHRSQTPGHYRYSIHELLRQYAGKALATSSEEVERVRSRHSEYFTEFLHTRLETIHGLDQGRAVADITEELDNVRLAWQWAVERADMDRITVSATTYFLYCQFRSRFVEGAGAMASAASSLSARPPSPQRDATMAQVLNHEGWLRIRIGDLSRAAAVLQESRNLYALSDMAPPPHMGSDPTVPLAMIAQMEGDYGRSLDLAEEALRSAEARGDPHNQAYAHYALTSAFAAQGDFDAAAEHADQACDLALAVGNRWFSAVPRNEGGRVARAAGLLDKADRYFRESHTIMAEYADREGMAVALTNRGEVALARGDLSMAERFYRKALEHYRGLGDRVGRATSLAGQADVAYARNEITAASQHYRQSLAIAAEAHFLPLILSLFVKIGNLLIAQGEAATGFMALNVAFAHESVHHETKEHARRVLARWRDSEGDRSPAVAQCRADVETTVDALLSELTALAESADEP